MKSSRNPGWFLLLAGLNEGFDQVLDIYVSTNIWEGFRHGHSGCVLLGLSRMTDSDKDSTANSGAGTTVPGIFPLDQRALTSYGDWLHKRLTLSPITAHFLCM